MMIGVSVLEVREYNYSFYLYSTSQFTKHFLGYLYLISFLKIIVIFSQVSRQKIIVTNCICHLCVFFSFFLFFQFDSYISFLSLLASIPLRFLNMLVVFFKKISYKESPHCQLFINSSLTGNLDVCPLILQVF